MLNDIVNTYSHVSYLINVNIRHFNVFAPFLEAPRTDVICNSYNSPMHWGFIDKTLVNTSGILFTAVLKGWSKCFHSINLKDQIYIHVYPECKAAIAARQTAIMIILHFPVILEWKQNKCIILFSTFLKLLLQCLNIIH